MASSAACASAPARCYVPRLRVAARPARASRRALRSRVVASGSEGWTGADAFTPLGDRQDAPPLPLPPLRRPHKVVLVRHGQSTWNAAGRIQGSTDFSELTPKGVAQADKTAQLLAGASFDAFFCSPLRRAAQTGARVWGARPGLPVMLPALREIDLYSLQGVVKAEVATAEEDARERMTAQLAAWKAAPAAFELDGHAPVRELWHRASLAWQRVLQEEGSVPAKGSKGRKERATLVVAHNAVNQALLGTAAGWGPETFRRFEQSNGALTTLLFEPSTGDAAPRVVVQCMNSAPEGPALSGARVLLAPAGGTAAAAALAAAMTRATLAGIMHARDPESRATAAAVQAALSTVVPKKEVASLGNLGAMPWTKKTGEPLGSVAARAEAAWASAVAAVAEERAGGGTGCILLIADQLTIAAVIRRALRLPPSMLGRFQLDACALTALSPSAAPGSSAVANAINNASHLSSLPPAPPPPAPWPAAWAALDWEPTKADGW